MKRIDVFKIQDLEKLQNLTEKDSIFLKIHKEFRPSKILAISLKDFQGAITIDIEEKSCPFLYKVYGRDKKNLLYFFEDTQNTNLLLNQRNASFAYFENYREYNVKDEVEFQKIFSKEKKEKSMIHLKKDLVIKKIEYKNECMIYGENHRLFLTKEEFHKYPFAYQDVEIILVDKVIYINRKEDLIRLENFTTENVAVLLKRSIINEEFFSISLKNFIGKLYFFGNHYAIRDCKIKSMTHSLGLFSVIHPYGSLYIKDLNLLHNHYIGENALILGCIMAKRKSFEQKYHSPNGFISIQNCIIEDNVFHVSHPFLFSSYVGYLKDNLEIINSKAKNYIEKESQIYEEMDSNPIIYSEFSNEKGIQSISLSRTLQK